MSVIVNIFGHHEIDFSTLEKAIESLTNVLQGQLVISDEPFGIIENTVKKDKSSFSESRYYLSRPFSEYSYDKFKELWLYTDFDPSDRITFYQKSFHYGVYSPDIPKFKRAMHLHFNYYDGLDSEEIEALDTFKENWSRVIQYTQDLSAAFRGKKSILMNDLKFQDVEGGLKHGGSIDDAIANCKKISDPVFTSDELPKNDPENWARVWTIITND